MGAVVVLAAGASTRTGGPLKALLRPTASTSVVRLIVSTSEEAGASPVLVVVGARHEEIERDLRGSGARTVVNAGWERGRTGSVKVGLRALPDPPKACLLWPVDHPFVRGSTLRSLLSAPASPSTGSEDWWVPTFEGHRGHPVRLGPRAQQEVLSYEDDEPLFRYPRGHPDRVREVPVMDPGVLENIDTPAAWEAARERWLQEGGG